MPCHEDNACWRCITPARFATIVVAPRRILCWRCHLVARCLSNVVARRPPCVLRAYYTSTRLNMCCRPPTTVCVAGVSRRNNSTEYRNILRPINYFVLPLQWDRVHGSTTTVKAVCVRDKHKLGWYCVSEHVLVVKAVCVKQTQPNWIVSICTRWQSLPCAQSKHKLKRPCPHHAHEKSMSLACKQYHIERLWVPAMQSSFRLQSHHKYGPGVLLPTKDMYSTMWTNSKCKTKKSGRTSVDRSTRATLSTYNTWIHLSRLQKIYQFRC